MENFLDIWIKGLLFSYGHSIAQEVLQKLSTTEIILLVWEKQPEIIILCPMVKHPLMNHLAAAQSEV